MTSLLVIVLYAIACLMAYGVGYEHGCNAGWRQATKVIVRFFEVPDTSPDGSPLSHSTIEDLLK